MRRRIVRIGMLLRQARAGMGGVEESAQTLLDMFFQKYSHDILQNLPILLSLKMWPWEKPSTPAAT